MPELDSLELPAPGRARFWTRSRLLFSLLVLLLMAAAIAGWWWLSGNVDSVAGRLDGMVHMVAPQFSGRLANLGVKEGDLVNAGQHVGSMDVEAYDRRLAEAASEAAALRPTPGPDMVESAARLRQAQEAERDFAVRMAQARHEEDRLRLLREERVTEYVRAQLALRSIEAQGGERAAGKEQYAAVREAELMARNRKEAAVADFERASLARAALDRELERIRQETMATRNHASQQRQRAALGGKPEMLKADGALFAPVQGSVLRRLAEPGQMLQAGEPALLIAPVGTAARDAFWVDAWFPVSADDSLKPGQRCRIRIGDASLSGTVREILPIQPLPEGMSASAQDAKESENASGLRRAVAYLPCRIALTGEIPPGLAPGAPAKCVVMTHGWPF